MTEQMKVSLSEWLVGEEEIKKKLKEYMVGERGREGRKAIWLSPQDVCSWDRLKSLIKGTRIWTWTSRPLVPHYYLSPLLASLMPLEHHSVACRPPVLSNLTGSPVPFLLVVPCLSWNYFQSLYLALFLPWWSSHAAFRDQKHVVMPYTLPTLHEWFTEAFPDPRSSG